jgi:hypothetical protein
MSDINPPEETSPETPGAAPGRKLWSAPRVITSEIESTEGGLVSLPEATAGFLS